VVNSAWQEQEYLYKKTFMINLLKKLWKLLVIKKLVIHSINLLRMVL